ncbi:hypothetical protein AX15_005085 [Amanita polypyramis BW_CC]|nr:hypothetical protein AX15_005085 [Amanita polypyramis BW_CC]
MFCQIRQLLDLITRSVEALEKTCAANGTSIPDLQSAFNPASEAFRSDPVAAEAASIITAATSHLSAIVTPPHITAYNAIGGHWRSGAIRLCLESHVTEILREAGPEGLHVDDIAAKNGMDAQKLARCLRFMATQHIYREVKPDVFTNNRVSSMLDTLKPSKDIIADPEHKFDNTNGFTALASLRLDDIFKGSSYLYENESDPKTAKSQQPEDAPYARALGIKKPLFEYYAQPEQCAKQRKFNIAMRGFVQSRKEILTGKPPHLCLVRYYISLDCLIIAYDWQSLPDNSLIVDVGGGIGSIPLVLAQSFGKLRFIIQDHPKVIEDGLKVSSLFSCI